MSFEAVRKAGIAFHASLWGSLALAAAIHLAAPLFADDRLIRFGLVIVFFGALASAAWSFADPYRAYLSARYRWRYADSGPAILRDVEMFLTRRTRFAAGLAWIGTAGALLLGGAVAAEWPEAAPLGAARGLLLWSGIACLLALPLHAAANGRLMRETLALRRQIEEQAQISAAPLRTAESEAEAQRAAGGPAVEVTGPMRFRAGGHEWLWSDFYKNAAIFGQSGSGKTLCVLNALLEGLLASSAAGGQPAAGLILDPKGDFRDKIAALCRAHGRAADLMAIDPYDLGTSIRWNPLDSPDDAMEIAGRFGAVMEVINPSGGDDKFWIESTKRLVQNLISLMRVVRPGMPPSLSEVYDAAMSDAALDRWGELVTADLLDRSKEARRAVDYFEDVWKTMPDNTKGSIRAYVSNMLGAFLVEPYDELFAGRSTETISGMLDAGRILYVHMPIADREVMARVVSTFVKLEFYREVLRRPNKARPSFFLCDEFQSFFTVGQGRGDADAFERTRQSNHANIVAFQNLNALLKQTPRPEPVHNMLGNCATKLFLRNTDKETNDYASGLFGEHIETLGGMSVNIGGGARGGGQGGTVSGAAQYAARVKKEEFSRLAVPSREDGASHAEAMAHLGARARIETGRQRWAIHPIGGR